MSTVIMTVNMINQPNGSSRGSIVGTDGQRIGCFDDKIGLFQVGKTYEIEIIEKEYNGRRLKNVKSAKEVAATTVAQTAAEPISNGLCHSKDREIWTAALYKSAIESGQVNVFDKQQMWEAGQIFLGLHRHLFEQPVLQATSSGTGVRRVA